MSLQPKVTVIEAQGSFFDFGLVELFNYRRFLFVLLWRDIKVRYKQSVFGIGWAVAQPVVMMVVFSVIFGTIANIPSNDVPYPIFSYAGLLPWLLFQKSLTQGASSLVSFRNELTKVYFPRIAAPLVALMSAGVDFVIAFAVLLVLMVYFAVMPGWQMLLVPLFVVYTGLVALSVVLWLSAMNVEYRDIGHVIPFLVQVGMYITPVVYPASLVPEKYALLYWLNPMVAVVEGFRWAILGAPLPPVGSFVTSMLFVFVVGAAGLMYFTRTVRTMADRV